MTSSLSTNLGIEDHRFPSKHIDIRVVFRVVYSYGFIESAGGFPDLDLPYLKCERTLLLPFPAEVETVRISE